MKEMIAIIIVVIDLLGHSDPRNNPFYPLKLTLLPDPIAPLKNIHLQPIGSMGHIGLKTYMIDPIAWHNCRCLDWIGSGDPITLDPITLSLLQFIVGFCTDLLF